MKKLTVNGTVRNVSHAKQKEFHTPLGYLVGLSAGLTIQSQKPSPCHTILDNTLKVCELATKPRTQNNALKMNRAGFFEEPNYKETRDSKGNLRLCYRCGLTPNGRDIIPCDFCPAKWHLDCTDPPLAVPPRRRGDDKPTSSWRCPLHTEHDLTAISRLPDVAPGVMGRVPKLRRPKNAVPLDVGVPRGHRNNGIIDVELMADEISFDKTKEVRMNGKVYRIPERGIRLDFIDRVKRSWYEDHTFGPQLGRPQIIRSKKYRPDGVVLHHPPDIILFRNQEPDFWTGTHALAVTETARANAELRTRSFREQQAVLNLAKMSEKGMDGYSGDALAELTNQLVSEAPPEVTRAVERSEIDQLRHLQELIGRRLTLLEHDDVSAETPPPEGTTDNMNNGLSPRSQAVPVSIKQTFVNGDTPESYASGDEADNEMHISP
ncbi:uncharacterized protein A1O9_11806 [Exophiala aquamarina CBS 119918]|uniref:Zinc finger PHD-type domain-containing protein n=1 Tax=Exophiala aquamarina CBS 119918 TaxID=1182545 RepID=A0A072NWC1_9EURO|nr:uncharacterized protein A1O9_11806 [Exophiala aquamarina CBS 119918]KEF52179.1 hypothetical protein A1O9_11806 [Exophiala aquamarina CBS 119918]